MLSEVDFEDVCEKALKLEGSSRLEFLKSNLRNEIEVNRALSYLETLTSDFWPSGLNEGSLNEEDNLVGSTIDARFTIKRHLGTGGQGAVFLASDSKFPNSEVAIKLLPDIFTGNPNLISRFFREAETLRALNDDRIVRVFDFGEAKEDGRCWIALEFVDGQDLRTILKHEEPLTIERVLDIANQFVDGLSTLHAKGLVHRDLKPANLMITRDKGRVKIIDLGIARFVGDAGVDRDARRSVRTSNAGTLAYMSPEQIRGDDLDWRTDVWSFGVIVYELLTGVRPFRGNSKDELSGSILRFEPEPVNMLRKDCPRWLSSFVARCLSKEREKRFESFEAFERSLKHLNKRIYQEYGVLRSILLLGVFAIVIGAGLTMCDKAVFDTKLGRVEVTPNSAKFIEAQLQESAEKRLSRWNASSKQCEGVVPDVPTFNYWPLTVDRLNTPLCSDFPVIDIALDTASPQFSSTEAELRSIKTFDLDDQLVVLMYIHNGGADNLKEAIARNVRINTKIESQGSFYKLTAEFVADNATPKSDFVTVRIPDGSELVPIAESGFLYDYLGRLILDLQEQDIGHSSYLLGDLDPGFEYSLFISYKLRVTKKN